MTILGVRFGGRLVCPNSKYFEIEFVGKCELEVLNETIEHFLGLAVEPSLIACQYLNAKYFLLNEVSKPMNNSFFELFSGFNNYLFVRNDLNFVWKMS